MGEDLTDNVIIADIIRLEKTMAFSEWKKQVDIPIQPFFQKLETLVKGPGSLRSAGISNRKPIDKAVKRQFHTVKRWVYSHPALPFEKNRVQVMVQLGDYTVNKEHTFLWGVNWWGSARNAIPVYEFFDSVKGRGEVLKEIQIGYGANCTTVRVISGRYTSEQLLSLQKDIKIRIIEDLKLLVKEMDDYWADHAENSSRGVTFQPKHDKMIDGTYLPTRADIERALQMLHPASEVTLEVLLEQVGREATRVGHQLQTDWRAVIEEKMATEWKEAS